jgi:large subunit ribosomal protein L23
MVKLNFLKKDKKSDAENKTGKEKKAVSKTGENLIKKPTSFLEKKEHKNLGWKVLKSPQITEKATILTEKNQYIFKIADDANKTEVRKAVEEIYKVDVLDVKIIRIPSKKRRRGKVSGWKKGYKKAVVKIKAGQKIELLPH